MRTVGFNNTPLYSANMKTNNKNVAFNGLEPLGAIKQMIKPVKKEVTEPIKEEVTKNLEEITVFSGTFFKKAFEKLSEPFVQGSGKYYGTRMKSDFSKLTHGFYSDSHTNVKKVVSSLNPRVQAKLERAFDAFTELGGRYAIAEKTRTNLGRRDEVALRLNRALSRKEGTVPIKRFMRIVNDAVESIKLFDKKNLPAVGTQEREALKAKGADILDSLSGNKNKIMDLISESVKDANQASIIHTYVTKGKNAAFQKIYQKVEASSSNIPDIKPSDIMEKAQKQFNELTHGKQNVDDLLKEFAEKNTKKIKQLSSNTDNELISKMLNSPNESFEVCISVSANPLVKDRTGMSMKDHLFNFLSPFRTLDTILSSHIDDSNRAAKEARIEEVLDNFLAEYDEAVKSLKS